MHRGHTQKFTCLLLELSELHPSRHCITVKFLEILFPNITRNVLSGWTRTEGKRRYEWSNTRGQGEAGCNICSIQQGSFLSHLKAFLCCLMWDHTLMWCSTIQSSITQAVNIKLFSRCFRHNILKSKLIFVLLIALKIWTGDCTALLMWEAPFFWQMSTKTLNTTSFGNATQATFSSVHTIQFLALRNHWVWFCKCPGEGTICSWTLCIYYCLWDPVDPKKFRGQRQDLYSNRPFQSHIRNSKGRNGAPRDINHLKKYHFLHPHLYSDMSAEKESPYEVRRPTLLTNNDEDFTFHYQLIQLFLQTFMSQYSPQGKHILL